uniref:Truncated bco2 protein n=2 Tax=Ovis TaxID=9935 RepID=C1L3B2_SHEEP|nr:truncated bco2 protein [Ovis aries]
MFPELFLRSVSSFSTIAVDFLSMILRRIPVLKKYMEQTHQKTVIFSQGKTLPCIAPLLTTVEETL